MTDPHYIDEEPAETDYQAGYEQGAMDATAGDVTQFIAGYHQALADHEAALRLAEKD